MTLTGEGPADGSGRAGIFRGSIGRLNTPHILTGVPFFARIAQHLKYRGTPCARAPPPLTNPRNERKKKGKKTCVMKRARGRSQTEERSICEFPNLDVSLAAIGYLLIHPQVKRTEHKYCIGNPYTPHEPSILDHSSRSGSRARKDGEDGIPLQTWQNVRNPKWGRGPELAMLAEEATPVVWKISCLLFRSRARARGFPC